MTRIQPPSLVVFDVDGTICDTTATIVDCWERALSQCDLPVPPADEIRSRIGQAIVTSLPGLVPGVTETQVERFLEIYREVYVTTVTTVPPPLFTGVRETLDALRQADIAIGVATSKSRVGLDRTLTADDLDDAFPGIYRATADDGPSKPHPKMLIDLLDRTFTDPDDAIMVGDTTFDIEMAHAAGVRAIAVTCGAHDRETLQSVEPAAIVGTVADVPSLWS